MTPGNASTPARTRIRRHIRSNVIGYLALFVALGGTATAAHLKVRSSDIVNRQVKAPDIAKNAVRAATIKNGHVRAPDLADDAVTGSKLAPITEEESSGNQGLGPGASTTLTEECESGTVVGGGFSTDSDGNVRVVRSSRSQQGNGWSVRFFNAGDTTIAGFTVLAYCLDGE